MDAEKDHFYWKNPQGIPEKHHVSEFRAIIFGEPGENQTSVKNPGESIREAGGKDPAETHDQKLV